MCLDLTHKSNYWSTISITIKFKTNFKVLTFVIIFYEISPNKNLKKSSNLTLYSFSLYLEMNYVDLNLVSIVFSLECRFCDPYFLFFLLFSQKQINKISRKKSRKKKVKF